MLNLLLKKSEVDDIFKETWELCFDEQRCYFYVCHSTRYVDTEKEPHVERFPLTACCDLITEKLKEVGFASDGKNEYVKLANTEVRPIYKTRE